MTRRGFVLMEMLTVIGLLGLIALSGGYLFSATVRLMHATGESRNSASSFDATIEALRADVWSATRIDAGSASEVTLHPAISKPVTWSIGEAVVTRRAEGDVDRRWTLGTGATFSVDGIELLVKLPQTKTQRGGEVRLPSQVQLLTRSVP